MQSRRDQVQAHMFVMGRLSSSMQRAEPDAPDTPTARTWRGIMWGLLVAALAAVVTTLYGLISPGGATSWRTDGALVVVKDSGARYLYVGGTLHPVLNEASARLLAGDKLSVQQVAAASSGTPRAGRRSASWARPTGCRRARSTGVPGRCARAARTPGPAAPARSPPW